MLARMTFDVRPPAPASFLGIQDGFGIFPPIALYILQEQVGVHPAGSTVSRQTLERHGYAVDDESEARETERMRGGGWVES